MMLVVDAGNSFIKWKLWREGCAEKTQRRVLEGSVPEELAAYAHNADVQLVLGSVANQQLESQLQTLFAQRMQRMVTSSSCLGVKNAYAQPEKMGIDRWAALLEAFHASGRQACCVFDLGTAATLDIVNDEGVHQGGYIVPGLRMMKSALLSSTDRVRFDQVGEADNDGYGCNTAEAVHRGVQRMMESWVQGEINRFRHRFSSAPVWLTGGDAGVIVGKLSVDNVSFCEDLVLDGLRRMAIE